MIDFKPFFNFILSKKTPDYLQRELNQLDLAYDNNILPLDHSFILKHDGLFQ